MSQKKIDKRRRKKAKDELRHRERELLLARRRAFPEIVYETHGAPESLVTAVKSILAMLIESPKLDTKLRKDLNAVRDGSYRRKQNESDLSIRLGDLVYRNLDVDFQAIHRMRYDIEFDTGRRYPRRLALLVQSLDEVAPRIFCSPKRFVADFQGQQLVIAFNSHTIERIGQRTVVDPKLYADRGKTFAFTYRYRYFDFARLANGDPAIRIWDFCNPEQFLSDVHAELLGPDVSVAKVAGFPFIAVGGKLCYYLVGYCPVEQYPNLPGYLILKTLLLPGMEKTPEFSKYLRSRRPDTCERMEFGKRAGDATYAGLKQSRDFGWIRLLHEFEPQVKPIEGDVFDYPENSAVKLGLKDFLAIQRALSP
ncbi:MAG: hypothetical protein ACO1RT_02870 [Planctomycetaceae bacterium]